MLFLGRGWSPFCVYLMLNMAEPNDLEFDSNFEADQPVKEGYVTKGRKCSKDRLNITAEMEEELVVWFRDNPILYEKYSGQKKRTSLRKNTG